MWRKKMELDVETNLFHTGQKLADVAGHPHSSYFPLAYFVSDANRGFGFETDQLVRIQFDSDAIRVKVQSKRFTINLFQEDTMLGNCCSLFSNKRPWKSDPFMGNGQYSGDSRWHEASRTKNNAVGTGSKTERHLDSRLGRKTSNKIRITTQLAMDARHPELFRNSILV
jgi:hypothetical protein